MAYSGKFLTVMEGHIDEKLLLTSTVQIRVATPRWLASLLGVTNIEILLLHLMS